MRCSTLLREHRREAIEATGERWCESDITAGDIALLAPEPDVNKAEAHFSRALAAAREQRAKSWELRAATSLARLWHDRGESKRPATCLHLYAWFSEGLQTLDLKQAKGLLDELS